VDINHDFQVEGKKVFFLINLITEREESQFQFKQNSSCEDAADQRFSKWTLLSFFFQTIEGIKEIRSLSFFQIVSGVHIYRQKIN